MNSQRTNNGAGLTSPQLYFLIKVLSGCHISRHPVCTSFRLSSAKPSAPVIMDGKRLSEDEEDEDEQFVVEEAVPPPSDAPEMEMVIDLSIKLSKNR